LPAPDLLALASGLLLLALLVQGQISVINLFALWAVVYTLVGWVPQSTFLAGYVGPVNFESIQYA
jgi:hypothetical protein